MNKLRAVGTLSRPDAAIYLRNVLQSWPVGQTNGLYATYGSHRHDIYDNAVMALAIMAVENSKSDPPPAVVLILSFFASRLTDLEKYPWSQTNKLLG